jgi:hypothetical protein
MTYSARVNAVPQGESAGLPKLSLAPQARRRRFLYDPGRIMSIDIPAARRAVISTIGASATEKRRSPRVQGSFPVRLRGFDESGLKFGASSLVDNISSGGLYLQLSRPVAAGSRLFAVVGIASGARIAAKGDVTRVERRPHGLCGVAVRFTQTRLLAAPGPPA